LISVIFLRKRGLVWNQNCGLARALPHQRGRFEYASQFKILWRACEQQPATREPQPISSCARCSHCRRCRGTAACYF